MKGTRCAVGEKDFEALLGDAGFLESYERGFRVRMVDAYGRAAHVALVGRTYSTLKCGSGAAELCLKSTHNFPPF